MPSGDPEFHQKNQNHEHDFFWQENFVALPDRSIYACGFPLSRTFSANIKVVIDG